MWEFIAGYFVGKTIANDRSDPGKEKTEEKAEPLKWKDILFTVLVILGVALLFVLLAIL